MNSTWGYKGSKFAERAAKRHEYHVIERAREEKPADWRD
jgi:hypothetical protein